MYIETEESKQEEAKGSSYPAECPKEDTKGKVGKGTSWTQLSDLEGGREGRRSLQTAEKNSSHAWKTDQGIRAEVRGDDSVKKKSKTVAQPL